jgi:hypothetical protein
VSVRGTTHARHMRRVIIREGAEEGRPVDCGWDDCTNRGFNNHRVQINEAKPGFPPKYINYVFCCDRHRQYFLNSHRGYGMLPTGSRGGIL